MASIGPKQTHRIMGEENLLAPLRKAAKRPYVKYRVVTPERPLHVLEMDIKSKWITGERRNGYILTILDTFTRQALHWQAGMSIRRTADQVKHAWDQVIKNHLQPADLLNRNLHVEVRNDNGPQFIAPMVQDYFKEIHLDQVFTHPYTPQENGHVESFHAILGGFLDWHTIWEPDQLQTALTGFYAGYNGKRIHGSTVYTNSQYRSARSTCSFSALLLRGGRPVATATQRPPRIVLRMFHPADGENSGASLGGSVMRNGITSGPTSLNGLGTAVW